MYKLEHKREPDPERLEQMIRAREERVSRVVKSVLDFMKKSDRPVTVSEVMVSCRMSDVSKSNSDDQIVEVVLELYALRALVRVGINTYRLRQANEAVEVPYHNPVGLFSKNLVENPDSPSTFWK